MGRNGRPESLAVVGGGIAGVSSALALAKSGRFAVTLYEKSAGLGGLCSSLQWEDLVCDRFYHVLLPTDANTLAFVQGLGLGSGVSWRESKSGFYGKGRLVPFTSSLDFLRFPFLSLPSKFRLGLGILRSTRISSPEKLELLTAQDWLTRIFGRKVYENFWDPLLRSKLGDARHSTSAAFMWATIRRLNKARSNASRKEHMGCVAGGYEAVFRTAERALSGLGVELRSGSAVEHLDRREGKIDVVTRDGRRGFDRVLLTVPDTDIIAMIPPETGPDILGREPAEYLGIVQVLVILRRPLSPYYVLNLLDKTLPFTGIIETTNVLNARHFGGRHLVYLPKYVTQDDPSFSAPAGSIEDHFVRNLKKVFPDLRDADILKTFVIREKSVQPLLRAGRRQPRFAVRTGIPGVYVANSAEIKDSTLNNDAVLAMTAGAVRDILAEASLKT